MFFVGSCIVPLVVIDLFVATKASWAKIEWINYGQKRLFFIFLALYS